MYATVCHCTSFVYRLFPESVHFLENHGVHGHQEHFTLVSMSTAMYATVRHLSTDCFQKVYTFWKTMAYNHVRHCMPLYVIVCYLSTDCFQKVYTSWKTMAYNHVRHCTSFVYRLFPESVHFLENHNSQSEKLIVQLLLTPRSGLVKLDIQMHP